jgi:hypothetical protein
MSSHEEDIKVKPPFILLTIRRRRMSWAGHEARTEKRNAYRLLVGMSGGKRPLRGPICGWVDNIKMDLEETGWCGMDRIGLALDRVRWKALAGAVMNLLFSETIRKFLSILATGGLSTRVQLHGVR